MFHRFQTFGLRRQMAGNALIEPELDLKSQVEKLGSHSGSPSKIPRSVEIGRVTPEYRRRLWVYRIALTDINICHSLVRE
jgi:hypothetical protein